jgi:glyoxylase I family protein
VRMTRSKISHVDLVVSSIEQSLPFRRGLLEPIGWSGLREVAGECGETIYHLTVARPGLAARGLREKRSEAHGVPYDRYAVGVHHVCFEVPSREVVDERAGWLRAPGARMESGPAEYDYTPGYYAVFFHDPDGIKLESCFTVRHTGSGCDRPHLAHPNRRDTRRRVLPLCTREITADVPSAARFRWRPVCGRPCRANRNHALA